GAERRGAPVGQRALAGRQAGGAHGGAQHPGRAPRDRRRARGAVGRSGARGARAVNRLVWGVFESGDGARAGVEQLIEAHFPPDEIKVLMRDREGFTDAPMHRKTAVPAGAALGATLGAAGAAGAVLVTGGGALLAAGPAIALLQAAGL